MTRPRNHPVGFLTSTIMVAISYPGLNVSLLTILMLALYASAALNCKLSRERLSWQAAVDSCNGHNGSSCRLITNASALAHLTSPLPVFLHNTIVWLGARVVYTLVWKNEIAEKMKTRFFISRGCHGMVNMADYADMKQSYGPFSCLEKCGQVNQTQQLMFLQGTRCYCANVSALNSLTKRANQCTIDCLESPYECGGDRNFFSVYDISDDVKLQTSNDSFSTGCFAGQFVYENGKHVLLVKEQSCDMQINTFCVAGSQMQIKNASEQATAEFCSSQPDATLPAKLQDQNYSSFVTTLYTVIMNTSTFSQQNLSRQTTEKFWLGLDLRPKPVWLEGGMFHEKIKSSTPGCIAMTTETASSRMFHAVSCDRELQYLSCEETEDAIADEDRLVMAIAAGVSGLFCLVVFIVIALVLYVLKRSGKLRIQKKPTFNSTGDWDQEDEPAATRLARRPLDHKVHKGREVSKAHHYEDVDGPGGSYNAYACTPILAAADWPADYATVAKQQQKNPSQNNDDKFRRAAPAGVSSNSSSSAENKKCTQLGSAALEGGREDMYAKLMKTSPEQPMTRLQNCYANVDGKTDFTGSQPKKVDTGSTEVNDDSQTSMITDGDSLVPSQPGQVEVVVVSLKTKQEID